ncbi:hypothetical protein D3C73_1074570 [compost metagenome]
MGKHARTAALRTNQQRQRVKRRIAGDAYGRFLLGKTTDPRLGGIGGNLHRVIFQVGDVTLVRGCASGAHFLQRHHHFHHVHFCHHLHRFRRGDGGGNGNNLFPTDVDIHQHSGDVQRVKLHCPFGFRDVNRVVSNKTVNHVELCTIFTVQFHNTAIFHLH